MVLDNQSIRSPHERNGEFLLCYALLVFEDGAGLYEWEHGDLGKR